MVKRKLNPFTADDAGDSFTPSVKTIKGGDIDSKNEVEKESKKMESKTSSSAVKKTVKKKTTSRKTSQTSKAKSQEKETSQNISEARSQDIPKEKMSSASSPKGSSSEKIKKESVVKKQESIVQGSQKAVEKTKKEKPVRAKKSRNKTELDENKEIIFELVGFMLGDEEFGINISNVSEINRMIDITPVPRAPFFVIGVMNLRGNVVPVVNLRRRLNIEDKEADNKTRIIVVEVLGTVVGFVVDSVSEVLRIPASIVEPASDLVAGIQAEYIKGVAKLKTRLMVLLDLEKILAKENIDQLKETTL